MIHIQVSRYGLFRFGQALKIYLYFIPALFIAYLFSYRPFFKTLANSVSLVNYSGRILEFVGFENYRGLFADRNFQTSLLNTIRFTVLFVPIDLVFCLICALLVYRKRRFNALNETLFILPMAVAMTSAAIAFKALFNPTIGVINHLLGLQIQWFNDPVWAMTTIVVLSVWMALGFDFLLLLAALRSVPRQLVESAQLEGAGRMSVFLRIQLPLISPTLLFIVTTRIRDGMLLSGPVLVMTEGGPFRSTQTLVYQMYIEGFKSGNYSAGSAISVVVFPLYYIFAGAFYEIGEFTTYPPTLFPASLQLGNFIRALRDTFLLRYMGNSLLVASVGSVLRMTIAILCAFPVAFLRFKSKNLLFFLVLGTMMLPSDALIIENYLTISRLGLVDSYFAIMSIYLLAPVQMFMLRQAFKTIPHTYREAAAIDGCTDFRFLTLIVLPMAKPIVLTLTLQSFVTIWNTYLWPLLVTNDPAMRTVQVGITMLGFAESLDFGPTFAAITLILLPSLSIFLFFRKRIVEGIATGAIVG